MKGPNIYEFLAFLTALEFFLLNGKYFSIDSKKTYVLQIVIFSSDTARPKWLPVGQANITWIGLYSTICLSWLGFQIIEKIEKMCCPSPIDVHK